MSAARNAEKLIILGDIANGLQCRLYYLLNYPKPPFMQGELEKFIKLLPKKFPEFPESLWKEKSYELFKSSASEITSKLYEFYVTFLDVVNFVDEAWKVLCEVAGLVLEFKADTNADIMNYYFTLLTRYIQIHLLVNLLDTPQLYIAAYARAFFVTSGNTEQNFARISGYLMKYRGAPLRKLQDECGPISVCVGGTLMSFMNALNRWSTVKAFDDSRAFNVVDDVKNITLPTQKELHFELLQYERMKQWTLWGFLICPGELARIGALDLLNRALKDCFALVIFRDKLLNVHEEYDKLFDYFKSGSLKLSKHTKILKSAYSEWEQTVAYHHELRSYLRLELETMLRFVQEFPTLCAPKILMLLAALQLSREEVLWYFRHLTVQPYKASSRKHYVTPDAATVSAMIHLVGELADVIRKYRREISQYYLEFVTTHDEQKLRTAAETLSPQLGGHAHVQQYLHHIVDNLKGRSIDDNFESIRLNWYRISCVFSSSNSGLHPAATQAVSKELNNVVLHSRHIDCVETQLKTHASFMMLFWYRAELTDMLNQLCAGGAGSAVSCMTFVKILNQSLLNVHRLCPEDQSFIGKESVTHADSYLRTIVSSLEKCLNSISAETEQLRKQTTCHSVISRLETQLQGIVRPLPGFESQYDNRKMVVNMRQWRNMVSEFSAAIAACDSVTVYNINFIPREYIIESISFTIRAALRGFISTQHGITKPSQVLNKFKDVIYTYSSLEQHININVTEVIRDVLYSEMHWDQDSGCDIIVGADAVVDPNAASQEPKPIPIIVHIATWYYNTLSKDLSDFLVVYSSLKQCFVTRKAHSHGERSAAAALGTQLERFTDVQELRALVTLIGPVGVSVIDRALIRIISKFVKHIKQTVVDNQSQLNPLLGRFTESQVWYEMAPTLTGLDNLLQWTTVIGQVMHFRELLKQAQHYITQQRSSFVQDPIELAFRHLHDKAVMDQHLPQSLDGVAADVGVELDESDHALRLALAKYKLSLTDVAIFNLLPELYGASYIANRWKNAVYQIDTEGHTNNIHCCAIAIRNLIVHINRIQVKQENMDVEKKIQLDLERFLHCSAYSLLHLHGLNQQTPGSYPLQNMMIFLEQFIAVSGGRLQLSALESCFPFTMLRTNYIQLYEKQTPHSYAPVADDDKD